MGTLLTWLAAGLQSFLPKAVPQVPFVFAIEVNGRDEFKYIEGEKYITFNAEMQSGDPSRIIYTSSIKRWSNDLLNDVVSEGERERIVINVSAYFTRNGITYELQ